MLQPNFEHHFTSVEYIKCSEIVTEKPTNPNQKPLSTNFGNSIKGRINAVNSLLQIKFKIELYFENSLRT